jgi:hypothetical protein
VEDLTKEASQHAIYSTLRERIAHRGATWDCMCRHVSTGECPGVRGSPVSNGRVFLCACHQRQPALRARTRGPPLRSYTRATNTHPISMNTPHGPGIRPHSERPKPLTDKTKPPRLILADLHHIARDQADMVSSMTRGAAALFRDSKKSQSPNQILDTAEAVLDDLEDVHVEIERRLQAMIDRARRNMRSTPTRKKAARVRKADAPATVATHDNVIAFKPRRDDSKTRPL